MFQAYLDNGQTHEATFEFFVRRLPARRELLTLVLQNLLGNAVKYSRSGTRVRPFSKARWANRLISAGMLIVLVAYLSWVWSGPRELGKGGWKVNLPSGSSTLLQIGIGILDLGSCALAMYMLLPDQPNIGFVTIAVVFVSATMLGFASHAPGGIGVFDAAMLVALWQFDKEGLLAGLLLFRLLYYIAPFIVALAILGARELIMDVRGLRKAKTKMPHEAVEISQPLRTELESEKTTRAR